MNCGFELQSKRRIMFESINGDLKLPQNMLADGGYVDEKLVGKIKEILDATVEIIKCNKVHEFIVLPKRWLVVHLLIR